MSVAESKPDRVYAPWSFEQVDALNTYQKSGIFHPFTCPDRGDDQHNNYAGYDLGALVATRNGWECRDCDYTQDWAHAAMADKGAIEATRRHLRDLGFTA